MQHRLAHTADLELHEQLMTPVRRRSNVWELRMRGEVVVSRLHRADTMFSRMRGLLGRSGLEPSEGLWIDPCNAIHMFFMCFAIDVVFLDTQQQVVRVCEDVRPWRMARGGKFAETVLELPQGTAAFYNIRVGDRMSLSPVVFDADA